MTRFIALFIFGLMVSSALARDENCLAAMHDHVEACTADCVAKARAAADPSVQDLIIGRACAKNCLKNQMFRGQTCP
ncbi:hypothetical protein [Beijerinckia sp. L45]|uniref:hypothetical protein n=1 Tax=Beijerinckia sp. L45 TaxID=1641855 RepID=UPI00131E66B7|nr:hypothetical protein [Beijerinckia sp. L45]